MRKQINMNGTTYYIDKDCRDINWKYEDGSTVKIDCNYKTQEQIQAEIDQILKMKPLSPLDNGDITTDKVASLEQIIQCKNVALGYAERTVAPQDKFDENAIIDIAAKYYNFLISI